MAYFDKYNNKKQYSVVDNKGKVVAYFRLKNSAVYWIAKNRLNYPEKQLKIINNGKL